MITISLSSRISKKFFFSSLYKENQMRATYLKEIIFKVNRGHVVIFGWGATLGVQLHFYLL